MSINKTPEQTQIQDLRLIVYRLIKMFRERYTSATEADSKFISTCGDYLHRTGDIRDTLRSDAEYGLKDGPGKSEEYKAWKQKTDDNPDQFIVAEITKHWAPGTPVEDLISQRFEMVINMNTQRGYKLKDWRLYTMSTEGLLTETIVAIFELNTNE